MEERIIPLSKGKFAIVDEEDFRRLSAYKWHYSKGYAGRTVKIEGKKRTIWMHREVMNAPDHLLVDHRNHNRTDNRKSNLRLATKADNTRYSRKPRHNTSGYKGVCYDKARRKWKAYIHYRNRIVNLGRFESREAAARAYDDASNQLFGHFAYNNTRITSLVQDQNDKPSDHGDNCAGPHVDPQHFPAPLLQPGDGPLQ